VFDAVEVVKSGTSSLLIAFNRQIDTFSSLRLIDFATAAVIREVQLPFVASRVFSLASYGSWRGEDLDPRFVAPVALCDPNEIPFVLDLLTPDDLPYAVATVQEFELRIHEFPCAAFWSSLASPVHPMLPLAPFQFRDGEKTLIFDQGIRPNVHQVPDRNTYNRLPVTFLGQVPGLLSIGVGFDNGCFELVSLEADADPHNIKILYSGRASDGRPIRSILYLEQPAEYGFLCVLSDRLEVYRLAFTSLTPSYDGLLEISAPKVVDIDEVLLLDRLPRQKGDELVVVSNSEQGVYVSVYSAFEDSVVDVTYLVDEPVPVAIRVDAFASTTQVLSISLLSTSGWGTYSLSLGVDVRGRVEQVESLGISVFSLSSEQLEALTGSPLPSLFDFCLDHGLCYLLCQYIGSLGLDLNSLEGRPQRLQELRQRAKDRFSRLQTNFVPLPVARSAFAVLLDLKLVYQELLYITDPGLMSTETRDLLHKDLDQIILLAQFYELQIWLLEQGIDRGKRNPCVETRRRRLELQHGAGLGPELFLDHLLERLSGESDLSLELAFRPLASASAPVDNFSALFEREHTLSDLVRLYQSGDPSEFREKRLLFLYVLLELERTTGEISASIVDSFISNFMVSEQDRNMTEAFWLLDKALDDQAIDEQITFDALARLDGTTDDWVNPILQTLVARDQPVLYASLQTAALHFMRSTGAQDKNPRYIFWTLLRNNLTFEALYYQRLVDLDTRRGLLRDLFEQLPTASLLQLPLSSEEQVASPDGRTFSGTIGSSAPRPSQLLWNASYFSPCSVAARVRRAFCCKNTRRPWLAYAIWLTNSTSLPPLSPH
jgi:hypothetical protein